MIDFGFGIQLSTLDPGSFELMRSWRNDYRIYAHCRQQDLISYKEHSDWFEMQARSQDIKMYEVRMNLYKTPIGICGLTDIQPIHKRAEFSLYIAPEHQSKSYGKKALKTLVSHGFSTFGLNCIWGECFETNPAHQMFESIGFKFDGIRRAHYYKRGTYIDAHLYSMLFSEWESNGEFEDGREQKCFI